MPGDVTAIVSAVDASSGLAGREQPREPEVENLRASVARDEDVLRLQIAMDDALVMRRGHARRHLRREIAGTLPGELPARQQRAQRLAFEQLRHHVGDVAIEADIEDRDDARMIERRGGLRFLREPRDAIRHARELGRQHLDGDLAMQPRIASAVDLAHGAGANAIDDLVRTEPSAGKQSHRANSIGRDPSQRHLAINRRSSAA